MSPISAGGLPHTRSVSVHGGGPVGTTMATGSGRALNLMDRLKGNTRVYPHFDDLVGSRPNVNINTPFKTILQMGEDLSKQAETNLDFLRPDIAFRDYWQARIIAVDILPKHKDFSALRDRLELNRSYIGFIKRVRLQDEKFTEVKEVIRENNTCHAVKPTTAAIERGIESIKIGNSGQANGHSRAQSEHRGIHAGAAKRPAPPVQPKPEGLHGKSIIPASSETQPPDLLTRFTRLRNPDQNSQVQDPRIRTQPIPISAVSTADLGLPISRNPPSASRPLSSRDASSLSTPAKISVDVNLSGMPRPPDAIYSPDRGDEPTSVPSLRSSSSFANVRKYSALPISTVGPSPLSLDSKKEYFTAVQEYSHSSPQNSLKRKESSLPDSASVSAEELMRYIGKGSRDFRVLLVDLRSREDFDSGHIMSQSIICVEPITLSSGISGEELSDRMVVAPDTEQALFDKREDFDLVVVYDQNSTSLTGSERQGKIQDFMLAVYEYGYEKKLQRRPALLNGGINAWIDLLGPNSLQITESFTSAPGAKSSQSLKKALALRNSSRDDRSKRRIFRQLTAQEQNFWETTLSPKDNQQSSDNGENDAFDYAKTTEDFFRRYPELPSVQQSMVSPASRLSLQHQRLDDELQKSNPKPPTRPAPALPRQKSSGITDRRMVLSPAHSAPNSLLNLTGREALTGLHNSGVTCYINSIVQALSASVRLRTQLRDFRYPPPAENRLPIKEGETGVYCSQLTVRCLGNLLAHLWSGSYLVVQASTFLAYVASIDNPNKPSDEIFGSPRGRQQDANEFFQFLMVKLEDELNPHRSEYPLGPPKQLTHDDAIAKGIDIKKISLKECCSKAKEEIDKTTSPLSKYMECIECEVAVCQVCQYTTRRYMSQNYINLPVESPSSALSLVGRLKDNYTDTREQSCENCNRLAGKKLADTSWTATHSISHFPDYFMVNLSRFTSFNRHGGGSRKDCRLITFSEEIDLSPLAMAGTQDATAGQTKPFIYEVYAVVCHRGGDSLQAGHWISKTRHLDITPARPGQPPNAGNWHHYSDTRVTVMTTADITNLAQDACLIFMRRKGVPNT